MLRDTIPAVVPERLPTVDVTVHVRRDRQTIEVDDAELVLEARQRFRPDHALALSQIRWSLEGRLLPDEIVLIFGRSLDWTGPLARTARGLTLVEDVFPHPFSLSRNRPWVLSGPPRVPFPRDVDVVGWSYGAVLVRGDDAPWTGSSVLRLVRADT